MRSPLLLACLAVWMLLTLPTAGEESAESLKEFRSAKGTLLQQLRSSKSDVRLAAVRKLGGYPLVDAAKVLLGQALSSQDEAVRKAAYEALLAHKAEREICTFLKHEVERDLKKSTVEATTGVAMGVLLASETPEIEADAQALLEQAVNSKGGPTLLITAVDELGAQGDAQSLRSLLKLKKLPPFEDDFGYRRAVVQALVKTKLPEAITTLVATLEGLQGEVRADVLAHLATVSGKRLETNQEWKDWWKASEAGFKFPAKPQAAGLPVGKAGPSYYGLPLYGAKLVFVIDTSGSMRGPRIDAAKRELTKALGELPDGVQFNVLAFNTRVFPWQQQLVNSSLESRRAAATFVQAQELGPATASYDALEAALSLPTEAIFFLTDGAPVGGKINKPDEIVSVISKVNRLRRVTIHCIGIGVGPDSGNFAGFLRTLAAQNFGVFRRVDE